MAWVTFPRGTVFIMGPIWIFFFPGPNMEKHFKRCLCLLFFKLVSKHAPALDKHPIDLRQMEQSWCFIFLIRMCLPDTGSQLWAGGLCALRVSKYFLSNPKDEVTTPVYTTRKRAGKVPFFLPWRLPFWAVDLFILGENPSLARVDSGLQLPMSVSPFHIVFGYPRKCELNTHSHTDNRQIWDGRN